MKKTSKGYLSRLEREIMDIVYRLGEASVADVADRMSGDTSYDSVRITLGILAKKGAVSFRKENRRYIYKSTVTREKASKSAMQKLLQTFYGGSPSRAILSMLDGNADKLSRDDLDRITEWIEKERKS